MKDDTATIPYVLTVALPRVSAAAENAPKRVLVHNVNTRVFTHRNQKLELVA